jgi:hypothetical protein
MNQEGAPPAGEGFRVYRNAPGLVTVGWSDAAQMVHVEWKASVDSAELRTALDRGIVALSKEHGSCWLADCQSLGPISAEDQEWLDQDWFPRALAVGLARMAIVLPWRDVARMDVQDIMGRVPDSLVERAYFPTVWQAQHWLTGLPADAEAPLADDPEALEADRGLAAF